MSTPRADKAKHCNAKYAQQKRTRLGDDSLVDRDRDCRMIGTKVAVVAHREPDILTERDRVVGAGIKVSGIKVSSTESRV